MLLEQSIASSVAEKRAHTRLDYAPACLIQTERRALHGFGKNISEGGICLRLHGLGALKRGDEVSLSIRTFAPIKGIVRWVSERTVGIQFTEDLTDHRPLATVIQRLAEGKPAEIIAPRKPDAEAAPPIDEIIRWVRGLDDV